MALTDKLTDIADAIRAKTGEADSMTLVEMKAGVQDVYDAGKQAEYDRFWDELQDYGNRTAYACTFGAGWTDAVFKPKYNLCPTDAYMMFRSSNITDLKNLDVQLDFSKCTNAQYLFTFSAVRHVGVVDLRALTATPSYAFGGASLTSIDKVIFKNDGTQLIDSAMFADSPRLTNLTIEGVIGRNLDFKSNNSLTHDSIMSVINALKDYSASNDTYTLTLGTTNLAKLTSAEKAIATEKGWTLA